MRQMRGPRSEAGVLRVEVKPEMLRWACERAGFDLAELAHRIPQLPAWERGDVHPTLKQLERFAKATRTPVGFLFLKEPSIERIPIPDFRTVGGGRISRPSPDLLDTLYICQQRQEWYRDFARSIGEESLPLVGSANVSSDVEATAARMRSALGFDLDERSWDSLVIADLDHHLHSYRRGWDEVDTQPPHAVPSSVQPRSYR